MRGIVSGRMSERGGKREGGRVKGRLSEMHGGMMVGHVETWCYMVGHCGHGGMMVGHGEMMVGQGHCGAWWDDGGAGTLWGMVG